MTCFSEELKIVQCIESTECGEGGDGAGEVSRGRTAITVRAVLSLDP